MPCNPPKTNADKMWPYEEYYTGERDEENRKNGKGMHNWTGAESLESYKGCMLRDTMHGAGDYRWRYLGPEHSAFTYEGRFYNNTLHGYGLMSYPDGRVFNGLWQNNIRWGPGVETHACLREDVGLWYGYQLIRLAWQPAVPSVAIDLVSNPVGATVVAPHRILLSTNTRIIGEVNSAIELLKQYGAKPLAAAEKWKKLYPKNCTDTSSQLCHVEAFDRAYYDNQIETLVEVAPEEIEVKDKDGSSASKDSAMETKTYYYAWNNNKTLIHMMKHCFTHEFQRKDARVSLKNILSGPRKAFKPAGKHELDCRTILMAAYLGHIANVAQLINESDVMSDVSDLQGNSVIMYAACGDQPDIIQFLVEAGADVDAYNDACCTPLGIALLRYTLEKQGIPYNAMLQAILPPPPAGPLSPKESILEWHINRDLQPATDSLQKSPSKQNNKLPLGRKPSVKDIPTAGGKKKPDTSPKLEVQKLSESDTKTDTVEDKRVYDSINTEYLIQVAEAFSVISEVSPIPYIFEVHDMSRDVLLLTEEDQKKQPDKNTKKNSSKLFKDSMKPSRDNMWQDKEDVIDTIEQMKQEKLSRIMGTILQLLHEGADPRKVTCPQPALVIAAVSGSADLVRHLMNHGADPDEEYPELFGYSTLDLAVSGPLTYDNLEVIRTLLEHGANPNRRLQVPEPLRPSSAVVPEVTKDDGATLLHAVIARKVEVEPESVNVIEIRNQIVELLLKYGCSPIAQYNGLSAVDVAMTKSMDLFDIFIKSPQTDLNAIINNSNQTMLVKMFYLPFCKSIPLSERLQTLTNLLLFGADPLIKCRNGKEEYDNLFVYVRKTLLELESARKPPSPTGAKKSKSEYKPKKEEKAPAKPAAGAKGANPGGAKTQGKAPDDSPGDYRQALELVVECARLLYIRWLQAKLMKELIDIVNKFSHRHWNMILKEHKNKKCAGLWLTAFRCLEIWDVLKTTKKKMYNDEKILKKTLCIIHFYYKRTRKILRCPSLTFQEKELIDREVKVLIHEHKLATMSTPDMVPAIRPYVTPELTVKGAEKFNVCFECAMPLLADAKITCDSCKLVSFCSFECMKINVDRVNCHPCSSHLKDKYFPTPESTETNTEIT
ncbi:ankyrin repeat and MYND domain-containing protein 1-like [Helicoverpa zea]|uniref:ankyrin repeat and MYND domain-containing protein 1-like n=1 Tax=Helicoverpa zea TaxID=7113 RepID=UPI001F57C56E|nr:ankyrin repeat and MYND domain-containing protein 1-like [Helicoverpa zea]